MLFHELQLEWSYRLFGMFHAGTTQDVILKSLLDPDRIVCVVFALDMGIDLKDVNNAIHYGAPQSLENYFQVAGSAEFC